VLSVTIHLVRIQCCCNSAAGPSRHGQARGRRRSDEEFWVAGADDNGGHLIWLMTPASEVCVKLWSLRFFGPLKPFVGGRLVHGDRISFGDQAEGNTVGAATPSPQFKATGLNQSGFVVNGDKPQRNVVNVFTVDSPPESPRQQYQGRDGVCKFGGLCGGATGEGVWGCRATQETAPREALR
jgi:hypothetical protein